MITFLEGNKTCLIFQINIAWSVENLRTVGLKDFKTGGYLGGGTFAGEGVSTPLNTMGRELEKLGHLDKGLFKHTRKVNAAGKHFAVLSLR